MATHDLKIWPEFFQAVLEDRKRFEYRNDDRGFKVGDVLLLREWTPYTENYTGRKEEVKVTYILKDRMQLGTMCIMSIEKVDRTEEDARP